MRCLALALALAPASSACAANAPPRLPACPAIAIPSAPAKELPARVIIDLTSDSKADGRLNGAVRLEGPSARVSSLHFRPSHPARIDHLTVEDGRGEVPTKRLAEGGTTHFELARPTDGTLMVRYTVVLDPAADSPGTSVESVEFRGPGEDLLVLPDFDAPLPVEIHLHTGGSSIEAASSFGLGIDERTTARSSELLRGYFIAGDVGRAAFHTNYGDDIAGWLGPMLFDPRWISAESAGIRSAVDAYVGRDASFVAPPFSFLFVSAQRSEPPVVLASRTHGLLVTLDRRSAWTASARLLVAQALAQRYIGGFLWVGDRNDEPSGRFFSEGFPRAIAREVLSDLGLLDHADRASELNMLLAATVFAEDPRHLATARGALIATALDVALRKESHGERTLQTFLRKHLAEAAQGKRDTLPLAAFLTTVRESAGDASARETEAAIRTGADVKLPPDLLAPCYRLVQKQLVPFDLGFVASAGEEMTVLSVKHGSRAEAAGVRAGDAIVKLSYETGRSGVPVDLVVKRKDRDVPLRFIPAGTAKPGRVFERVSGLPNDRC